MNATSSENLSRPGDQPPAKWPLIVVAAAWAAAGLAALTGQTYLVNHDYLIEGGQLPPALAILVFIACWQVMVVGMMLPSSMPMVYMFIHASRQERRPMRAVVVFLAGYAVVWTAFALAALAGDSQIHRAVDSWQWLARHTWVIGSATFAIAGLFQFSGLKERCLKECRSPFGFFVRYYRRGTRNAWNLGLRHGLFCLGCCWALMLVMFGVGVGSVTWMAALAGVMLIEKTAPKGKLLSPVVGVAMLALAVIWYFVQTGGVLG
jgi:predicted metal-binding membrane protein